MLHRLDQVVIKAVLGMQTNIRFVASNIAQVEPVIGKILDEPIEAGTVDQPIGLTAKCVSNAELSRAGQFHQRRVRPRVRQEMRQPRGDGVLIEIASCWIRRFAQIKEVAGTEERLVTGEHRLRERAPLLESLENELLEPQQCFFRDRFASSDSCEAPQQAPCVIRRTLGSDLGAELIEQHLV